MKGSQVNKVKQTQDSNTDNEAGASNDRNGETLKETLAKITVDLEPYLLCPNCLHWHKA